jgi:hypothetical protein
MNGVHDMGGMQAWGRLCMRKMSRSFTRNGKGACMP